MTTSSLSRRAFLRGALGASVGVTAASLPLVGCKRVDYPPVPRERVLFTDKEWTVLDAAAHRLLPPGAKRLSAVDVDVATAADRLLSKANVRIKSDVKQLLNTFEDATWLALRFEPFSHLDAANQDAVLASWQASPLGIQRQGFAAMNKICAMLFYMDPATWKQIGFPGPWVGRLDVGLGLLNQGALAANPNPNVFARFPA